MPPTIEGSSDAGLLDLFATTALPSVIQHYMRGYEVMDAKGELTPSASGYDDIDEDCAEIIAQQTWTVAFQMLQQRRKLFRAIASKGRP